ncbi:MAG: hypothetical protein ABI651_05430 [Verrucomicrobiota bacterium]
MKPTFAIRVHLTDGSVESFAQDDEAEAQKLWDKIEPSRLFAQSRLVLAGEHSKSVYVTAQIVRVDFIQESNECWEFPGGYSDIVELSEEDFRKHARLDQPERMARRNEPTPVGDLLVSFLKLHLAGGKPLFLMIEFPVKLPVENHSFMQFMLSKSGFHMRLCGGGIGVVNLANLLGYTIYPGVPQLPADTWLAEPVLNQALER